MLTAITACGSPADGTSGLLTIVPDAAEVEPGDALKFETDPDAQVSWSIVEPDGGAIDQSGLYSAPEVEGTFTVAATSLAGDFRTSVKVKRNLRVEISPSTATLAPGESIRFIASVTTDQKDLTWSVAEGPAGGTVTADGLYTAPQTPGTYTVVAASALDPKRSDRATITVGAPAELPPPPATVAIAISPATASVLTGGTVQFGATVTGSADVGATWSVAESGGGTVSGTGLYTAPATPGTYHVVAASHADSSKTSSATVTVSSPVLSRPVISSFSASPATITQGETSRLSWSVSGETSMTIDNGIGPVTNLSSTTVTPSTTTRYTLTATNAAGSATAIVVVTVNAPPPTGGGDTGGSDIGACTALVSHTNSVPTSPLARPAYGRSVIDPDFKTRITRVTGDYGTPVPNPYGDPSLVGQTWRSEAAGPTYAKDSAWNADQSIMVIKRGVTGHLFVDGDTYEPLFLRTRGRSSFRDWSWHPANPRYGIYVKSNGEVGWWDPRADTVHVKLAGNSAYTNCRLGNGEGSVSNDGRYLVVQCGQSFFAVDTGLSVTAQAVKYPTITMSSLGFSNLDWVSISPLGKRVIASQNSSLTKSAPLSLGMTGGQFTAAFSSGHFDLGLAADGSEVAYKAGGPTMFNLATGASTSLGPSNGAGQYHGSTRNVAAPGWGYGSLESTRGIMQGELVAHELKAGGRIRRLAHHRTNLTSGGTQPTYDHMAFGTASPDGKRMLFRSDWGNGSSPVYGYVVDTRNLCP